MITFSALTLIFHIKTGAANYRPGGRELEMPALDPVTIDILQYKELKGLLFLF